MDIAFDPAKRAKTLQERGLDFADAAEVFAGDHTAAPDDRFDYGEDRFVSIGMLRGRAVAVVWTPRDGARRVISMRFASGQEAELWRRTFGGGSLG